MNYPYKYKRYGNGDLISRKALLAEIDPQHMVGAIFHAKVKAMPAVEPIITGPVPVIRCKDCIHRGSSDCPMYVEDEGWCEHCSNEFPAVDRTEDDGFCHLGTITNAEE